MKKRIVVLVSGGGTNLQALIDCIQNGKITNGEIVSVISSTPDAFALQRAAKANIKGQVLNRKEFSDRQEYTAALTELVKQNNPDLIVLAGFMCILSEDLCKLYENRIINVHPALIPSFCGDGFYGLRVHQKALEKGVKISGATVHFVNGITDGGPIIAQKATEVLEDDTPESLQARIMVNCEQDILPRAVNLFCNDALKVVDNKVIIKKL